MSVFIWSRPTARKRHRCGGCSRLILPGEDYDRMFGADGDVWTYKSCRHCYRVAQAWMRWSTEYEWDAACIAEFLQDEHPALYASMLAGWRYPDGDLVPLPFPRPCAACRTEIPDDQIWCPPCDIERIERVTGQFADLARSFA